LIEDLKSELGGHFEDVIVALVIPPVDYLCKQLHKAMEGMGTDEHTLIEILCSKSNKEVKEIVDAYERRKYLPSLVLEQWFSNSQLQHSLVTTVYYTQEEFVLYETLL
jgi:hypothetical protein